MLQCLNDLMHTPPSSLREPPQPFLQHYQKLGTAPYFLVSFFRPSYRLSMQPLSEPFFQFIDE